jgi:hypothetical protein
MMVEALIEDHFPQVLVVDVAGPDVARFDGNRPPGHDDPEEALPDIVALWAQAVDVGLLGGPSTAAGAGRATLRSSTVKELHQRWELEIDAIDWGALRVLRGLLASCELDTASMKTLRLEEPSLRERTFVAVASLELPSFRDKPPRFPVHRRVVTKSTQARFARISFVARPVDILVDTAIAALDVWAELVLRGGYAADDQAPGESSGFPGGAMLYDERSVAQSFPDLFLASSDAFEAVVSHACALEARGAGIEFVEYQ